MIISSTSLSRRFAVERQELDVVVGDVIQIGQHIVTVVEIENGEVTFRIDQPEAVDEFDSNHTVLRPR
jgi:hypothetical protein